MNDTHQVLAYADGVNLIEQYKEMQIWYFEDIVLWINIKENQVHKSSASHTFTVGSATIMVPTAAVKLPINYWMNWHLCCV